MKKVSLIFAVLLVSISGFSLMGMDMPGSSTKSDSSMFTGYLSDVMSAESNSGITHEGLNLKLHPEKHTAAAMKTLPSAMSGYGLLVKDSDDKYSFYRFDKRGTELSKDLLKKTKKKDGISIHVTGNIKDNILCVDSIQEM